MSHHDAGTRAEYRTARDAFEALPIQDRALFLLEATVTTLARGIESAGQAVAAEMERAFQQAEKAAHDAADDAAAREAETPPDPSVPPQPPLTDDPTS